MVSNEGWVFLIIIAFGENKNNFKFHCHQIITFWWIVIISRSPCLFYTVSYCLWDFIGTCTIARFMAHLGTTEPMWAPCWPHELCYIGGQTCTLRVRDGLLANFPLGNLFIDMSVCNCIWHFDGIHVLETHNVIVIFCILFWKNRYLKPGIL